MSFTPGDFDAQDAVVLARLIAADLRSRGVLS